MLKSILTIYRLFFVFIIAVLLIFSCKSEDKSKNSGGFTITDDLHNRVHFKESPQKIISLAPNLTEMIFDLGLESYLVGNTLYCNYPEDAKSIEKVGDMLTFNFEKVVKLKPDLIFITVEGNTKETYDKFHELGLKIFVSNPRNFEGIKKTYSDIGKIFKIGKSTNKKISRWESIVEKIKKESQNHSKKTAMFLIELKPIMLAGKNTFLNEYLKFCGLQNIASDVSLNYPIFNREEVLRRDPDYIIFPTGGDDSINNIISVYPEWKNLKAVKNRNVIFIDRDLYLRPGPRFAEALDDFNNRLRSR